MEALRQYREDNQGGTELYWNRMRPICATRLADIAADILTIPASSVPSERLFSVAGVMCAGEQCIHHEYLCIMLFVFFFRQEALHL